MTHDFRARNTRRHHRREGALRRAEGNSTAGRLVFEDGFDTADLQAAHTLLDDPENSAALEAALVRS
jgi:hypothetical protein